MTSGDGGDMQETMVPDDLRADMMRVSELVPYAGNAKRHPDWQVGQIASSIRAFGFNDPIAIWDDIAGHHVIVEGHGRLLAAKLLGMEEVPVIRLDQLDDEARRAYTLAHNKLTMNTDFDIQLLDSELDAIEGFDMAEFGFDAEVLNTNDWSYTDKVGVPQYEPSADQPALDGLCDTTKRDELLSGIEAALGISDGEREFLRLAASRHIVFDYAKIADYYAHASSEMQRLMEKSALVIIDIEDAIANGYADLSGSLTAMAGE